MFCAQCGLRLDEGRDRCASCGYRTAPPRPDTQRTRRSGAAAWLAATLGILLACVVLVSTVGARFVTLRVDRGRQAETMGLMQYIADGIEAFAQDHGEFPTVSNVDELDNYLVPRYLDSLPKLDAWSQPFDVRGDAAGFVIRSAGRDRVREVMPTGGPRRNADADIVYSHGGFVQWPEGI